jgi:hypothetical protein
MVRLRRSLLAGGAIWLLVLLLMPGGAAGAAPSAPRPIPGGIQIPKGPLIHIYLPGPKSVTLPFSKLQLMGEEVEPSTITNSRGFVAMAALVGRAGDAARPSRFNIEADIRVFQGEYVGGDGRRQRGTFALI